MSMIATQCAAEDGRKGVDVGQGWFSADVEARKLLSYRLLEQVPTYDDIARGSPLMPQVHIQRRLFSTSLALDPKVFTIRNRRISYSKSSKHIGDFKRMTIVISQLV